MSIRFFYNAWLFFILLLPFGVAAEHTSTHLPKSVAALLKRHALPIDAISLYIKEYNAAKPLLAINIDQPRSPASVIKLLVTQAGLELLGPDYTWMTRVYLDGHVQNGTLNGNIIIMGGGDPLLEYTTFWHMLRDLQHRGLKHINGDLLINNSLFEPEQGSLADFDKQPYRAYNTFPSALLLNLHAHHFHFIPGDGAVHIYADPVVSNMRIVNRLRLTNGPCRNWKKKINFDLSRKAKTTIITFNGTFSARCAVRVLSRAVLTEKDYVFGVFTALWQGMGGTISGSVGETSITTGTPFYSRRSKPLHEIITYINKYSNNVMARQLLLTIAAVHYDTNSNKALGRSLLLDWLQQIGIPASGLFIENGAGLSRRTRISARSLALLLQHIMKSQYQPELFASLPLVGVDGTTKQMLQGEIPPAYARIKTGMIDDVKAIAGYLRSKNDKNYIIVLLQNYPGVDKNTGALVQEAILKWLYQQ